MKSVNTQIEIVEHNINIDNLLDRFVKYVDISDSSIRSYVSGIRAFLKYTSENSINNPTRETVIDYKKYLSQNKSTSTIALYLSSLRRFFSWTASEGLYPDVTAGIKSPRIDTGHKKDCFTANQIKSIISEINRNTLKGKRDYALFCLISATGLRTVEAMRANVGDIRNVYGENCLFIMGKGKTSKGDFVKISQPVMEAITTYLQARGVVEPDTPLFASLSHHNFGKRMTTYSISRICKSAMRHSGFNTSKLTAHSLRHTAITLALLQGISLQDVSQFARHSNITITMIYAHDVERIKSKCENAISNAIFG